MTIVWWMLLAMVKLAFGSELCSEDSSDTSCLATSNSLLALKKQRKVSAGVMEETPVDQYTGDKAYKENGKWRTMCFSNGNMGLQGDWVGCRKYWRNPQQQLKKWNGQTPTNFRDNCIIATCEKTNMMWKGDYKTCGWSASDGSWSTFGICVVKPPTPFPTPSPTPRPTPSPIISYRFKNNLDRKCLDLDVKSDDVIVWNCHTKDNQRWIWAGKQLKNAVKKTNKCITLEEGKDGANVKATTCSGSDKQTFRWDGKRLRAKTGKKMCLDADKGDHQNVIVWGCHEKNNQQWESLDKRFEAPE
mmetsp:Transcript_647/g.1272  ORF Transcript_647/g.1272 Transcript_647/m.1272 type:complete len:302 (-) Transcript_647:87-992(-)